MIHFLDPFGSVLTSLRVDFVPLEAGWVFKVFSKTLWMPPNQERGRLLKSGMTDSFALSSNPRSACAGTADRSPSFSKMGYEKLVSPSPLPSPAKGKEQLPFVVPIVFTISPWRIWRIYGALPGTLFFHPCWRIWRISGVFL